MTARKTNTCKRQEGNAPSCLRIEPWPTLRQSRKYDAPVMSNHLVIPFLVAFLAHFLHHQVHLVSWVFYRKSPPENNHGLHSPTFCGFYFLYEWPLRYPHPPVDKVVEIHQVAARFYRKEPK